MAVLTPTNMVRNGSVSFTAGALTTSLATPIAIVRALGESIHTISGTTAHFDSAANVNQTPSTESTGFCDVLIPRDEKIGLIINWVTSSTAVTANVVVAKGNAGSAWQKEQGLFYVTMQASEANQVHQRILGPFESARFAYKSTSGDDAIKIYVSASASDDDCSEISVQAFKMPQVEYDT